MGTVVERVRFLVRRRTLGSRRPVRAALYKTLAAAMTLSAVSAANVASAQTNVVCSVQELLRNDENYFSEVRYTLPESCRRRMVGELQSLVAPSVEERYLLAKLTAVEGQEGLTGQAYARLCEVEKYARACSAAAMMVDDGKYGNRDADLMRFLEAAATNDVPAAQVSLGDVYILRFEKSDAKTDFCAALQWWGRAARLGDSAAIRRVQKAPAKDRSACD
jgi:hypothetical protein